MIEQSDADGRRSVRGLAAAAALVLVGTTTSCSSETPAPDPIAGESPSASATPTPSPSPRDAPTVPPEARGTSDEAAIAFVEHVLQVLNYSTKSLDTLQLVRLSDPDCAACKTIVEHLQSIRAKDGFVRGGAWRPVESIALRTPNRGAKEIRVLVRFGAQRVVEGVGEKPTRHPSGSAFFTFFVAPEPPGWRVLRIESESS
jgi:hypothetical protein